MTGTFPPDYFGPDFFGPDYFGGESNPNALSANLAGTSTLTAFLTSAPANSLQASLAGTSSLTANLTAAPAVEEKAGGGGKRRKRAADKPETPYRRLPIIQRPGLPSVYYRDFKAPAVEVAIKDLIPLKPKVPARVAAALAASRVEAMQADAVAKAEAQQARNEQAIQALLAIIPLLDLDQGPDANEQAVQVLSILPMILEEADV